MYIHIYVFYMMVQISCVDFSISLYILKRVQYDVLTKQNMRITFVINSLYWNIGLKMKIKYNQRNLKKRNEMCMNKDPQSLTHTRTQSQTMHKCERFYRTYVINKFSICKISSDIEIDSCLCIDSNTRATMDFIIVFRKIHQI